MMKDMNNPLLLRIGLECDKCSSTTYVYVNPKEFINTKLTPEEWRCIFCSHLNNIDDKKRKEVIKRMKKRKVEETIEIPEGRHVFKVVDIQEREQEYKGNKLLYIDFIVSVDELKKEDGNAITIKLGFPDYVSKRSGLGRFYETLLDTEIKPKSEVDIDKLMEKSFSATTENDKDGYARISKTSITPV